MAPPVGLRLERLEGRLARFGARLRGAGDVSIRDVKQDSRRVEPGDLFAVRRGERTDGARFVAQAVAAGAAAILAEARTLSEPPGVPLLEVDAIDPALAFAAEAVHGDPSGTLGVIGITGTNGKTTSAWLTAAALDGAGARTARLGTLGFDFGGGHDEIGLTTPFADEISRCLARVRDGGGSHLVMEVSSHALAQRRVEAIRFQVAAFTNLTQDHLDFHGTMQRYAATKERLFTELDPAASVINIDDPFGRRLAARARGRVLTVGRREGDVRLGRAELGPGGIQAQIVLPSGAVDLASPLVGEHNLDNCSIALGIVEALGMDVTAAARALSQTQAVPGRLERCDGAGDDLVVLVDYAHTPDALRRALGAVRGLTRGRIWCVFGCGGDRDPKKRPKMGAAVAEGADRAVLTSDNPRSEAPAAIAAAVEPALKAGGKPYDVELDRAKAISLAVTAASPGDVVLIAGKGHEPYQIIGEQVLAFDDREQARAALRARRGNAG